MKTTLVFLLPNLALLLSPCEAEDAPPQKRSSMPYYHVSFSPDGKWLVAGGGLIERAKAPDFGGEGVIKIWGTTTWKQHLSCTEGFTDWVADIFFISNKEFVVTSDKIDRQPKGNPYDGRLLRFWNIPGKKELPSIHLKRTSGRAGLVGIHGSGKLVAFSNDGANAVYEMPALKKKITLEDGETMRLRFSPDGKTILGDVRENSPHLRLFDASNGKRIAAHALDSKNDLTNPTYVRSVDFSSDGKLIAVGEESLSRVYIIAGDLSKRILTIDTDEMPDCVGFSPDSQMVAVPKGAKGVQLVSINTKKPVKTFDGNPEGARGWCFSPDGAWIAIASGGPGQDGVLLPGRVRVFEVKTGKLVAELE